ncbi:MULTISPECIES: hypothetical protein [Auritidibacter]|uniref:hypothetical protein n=1 Tax=Auritidibacter TaxID=1160973 RepID=UPI000D72D665|nr:MULTISPECIES: hypothetical protein [Auritidibacter]PXA76527.1 hypothetical protein DCC24_07090 [Auritidibacter sp. NML100628]WHS29189.1 hypothetical protein QM395_05615 [Auritidibacter ignavus]
MSQHEKGIRMVSVLKLAMPPLDPLPFDDQPDADGEEQAEQQRAEQGAEHGADVPPGNTGERRALWGDRRSALRAHYLL